MLLLLLLLLLLMMMMIMIGMSQLLRLLPAVAFGVGGAARLLQPLVVVHGELGAANFQLFVKAKESDHELESQGT